MSDRIPLGETRSEAISRVQERLGPATSRPLAEKTFWALARKGKITMDTEGAYLIEAAIEDNNLRVEATDILAQQTQHNLRRSRAFKINHNNTHKARVSTAWQASVFSPTLLQAEGFAPDDNTGDDTE